MVCERTWELAVLSVYVLDIRVEASMTSQRASTCRENVWDFRYTIGRQMRARKLSVCGRENVLCWDIRIDCLWLCGSVCVCLWKLTSRRCLVASFRAANWFSSCSTVEQSESQRDLSALVVQSFFDVPPRLPCAVVVVVSRVQASCVVVLLPSHTVVTLHKTRLYKTPPTFRHQSSFPCATH